MKASNIKKKQHKLYTDGLLALEAGLIQPKPFVPVSDFGQLIPSKSKKRIKL